MSTLGTGETPLILLVDPERAIPSALVSHVEDAFDQPVVVEASLDDARTRLAATPIDRVLVSVDPGDGRLRQFVDDAGTIAPGVPVVLLTTESQEGLPEALLSGVTTVVEHADDSETGPFLVEKIRSAGREVAPEQNDLQQYRTLVESARDGLYRLDANGNTVYANESWAAMLGYGRGEILGVHASKAMADGELERGQRHIQDVLEDEDRDSDIMDLEMRTKSGETLIVSIRFVVLTTDDGAYDGIVGVARDVTDRRERKRELERKNDRLEQFASMVSHDLRNPLATAEGYLELARETDDAEHFEFIAESHERMDRIIDDLLWLAREGRELGATEPVDLAEQVRTAWRMVTGDDDAATLDVVAENLGTLRADEDRLCQLLENLFRNAIDHGGDDVTVRVESLPDGFAVADDGPGIPTDEREAVFERGYSTAPDGVGFGLSIVDEIVDAHGWNVTITDSDLGGVRFEITTGETTPVDS